MTVDAKRLRIAVLNRTFVATGGGAERYSIALVEQLAQRHEIHVFAQHIEHHWPGVTYHRLWTPFVKPRWINQLWFALTSWWFTRRGFDLVHSHENTCHGQIQTVHVLPVKYSLFNGRNGWRLAMRWLKVLTSPRLLAYLWLEHCRYTVRDGRSIVVTSTSLRDILAQAYPLTVPAIRVVTPGVASVPGLASKDEKASARMRLGLPADGACVLFVGNDYKKKGLVALLQALQQLPADVYLAVVGNAAQVSGFREPVKSCGLEARVFFLGSLNDVSDAYRAADCLAHPTLEDTFAMVVLEAMAHGLPVVVSSERYCGISKVLENGVNAIILDDPSNAIAISQAVSKVLGSVIERQKISDAGIQFARSFLWSEIAVQQEQIYYATLKAAASS